MKVPFTLRKTERSGRITAVLLLTDKAAGLLALCARIAAEVPELAHEWPALPPIHAVPGGFLVKLNRPVAAIFPGTIRLRSLAANLFVPAGADLLPTLLDDEAASLTRARGLVFLPGGRVLAFDPDCLLTADTLLTLPRLPGRTWQALPKRPPRPERLTELLLDLPNDTPDLILESGGENIGIETPRPADAGPAAKIAGQAALGAGRGLAWLGNVLRWPGMAKLGAALAAGAMHHVPRLSESLLGQQEAALRELLRQFRGGDLEKALRHALPLSDSPGRGGQAATNASLPTHNLFYRLADLLRGGDGPASIWLSSEDIHGELLREYRKAAEAATARGDYRRAAFIYGRLLHNYQLAADVLARGGLHHDAAVLYLEKLNDSLAAARAFEAAGETDRALQLYRQRGEHIRAGDLLRRLGEDEEAVRHYLIAADQFVANHNHVGAGDLLFARAQRPDLALRYLAAGWALRPRDSAIPCLLRLTRWHAEQDEQRHLCLLLGEAEEFFAPPGNDSGASQFFNVLAGFADLANLTTIRDELRDRALRGVANKLRQRGAIETRPGTTVSTLLGQPGTWSAAVVSDADFAFKAALKKETKPPPVLPGNDFVRVRVHTGVVSAVCAARGSGRVFLGFINGDVACFDPSANLSMTTCVAGPTRGPIVALSTDHRGQRVILLNKHSEQTTLFSLDCSGTAFRIDKARSLSGGAAWLTPIAEHDGQRGVGLWEKDSLALLFGNDDLLPWERFEPKLATPGRTALLCFCDNPYPDECRPLVFGCVFLDNSLWYSRPFDKTRGLLLSLGWRPCCQLRGLCSPPPLSWLWPDPFLLEFAGIDEDDSIHWNQLDFRDTEGIAHGASTERTDYLAAALIRPGLVAGVTRKSIEWLRRDRTRLVSLTSTPATLEDVIACAPSLPTQELLVICREGVVVRVPLANV